jgi:hypothetical protein
MELKHFLIGTYAGILFIGWHGKRFCSVGEFQLNALLLFET